MCGWASAPRCHVDDPLALGVAEGRHDLRAEAGVDGGDDLFGVVVDGDLLELPRAEDHRGDRHADDNQNLASETMSNVVVYCRTLPTDVGLTNSTGGEKFDPFGYPPNSDNPPAPVQPPHRLSEVAALVPLTQVWVEVDADQVGLPTAGWSSELPIKPVHGSVRNYIFFDGHVETRKVGPSGKL